MFHYALTLLVCVFFFLSNCLFAYYWSLFIHTHHMSAADLIILFHSRLITLVLLRTMFFFLSTVRFYFVFANCLIVYLFWCLSDVCALLFFFVWLFWNLNFTMFHYALLFGCHLLCWFDFGFAYWMGASLTVKISWNCLCFMFFAKMMYIFFRMKKS